MSCPPASGLTQHYIVYHISMEIGREGASLALTIFVQHFGRFIEVRGRNLGIEVMSQEAEVTSHSKRYHINLTLLVSFPDAEMVECRESSHW